jgi:hypothetical protein
MIRPFERLRSKRSIAAELEAHIEEKAADPHGLRSTRIRSPAKGAP